MSNQIVLHCFECGVTYEDDGGEKCRNCEGSMLWQVPLCNDFLDSREESEDDNESE